jgi:hypothetical protein
MPNYDLADTQPNELDVLDQPRGATRAQAVASTFGSILTMFKTTLRVEMRFSDIEHLFASSDAAPITKWFEAAVTSFKKNGHTKDERLLAFGDCLNHYDLELFQINRKNKTALLVQKTGMMQ